MAKPLLSRHSPLFADEGTKRKLNVIFILADDQGAWALGCAGNREIHTPNLDRLASEGMRFDHFFCTSPVCSPARASIFTGRIPSQHGVLDWLRSGNVEREALDAELQEHPAFRGETKAIQYLEGQTAYTEILAQHGFCCGLSGKWHLGDSATPQKGFHHWFTIARGGCDYDQPDVVRNGKIQFESRYVTDLITEDALRWLDDRDETAPFYLSVHYTAPHSPWDREQHPQDIYALYEDCPFHSVPEEPPNPWQIDSCPHGEGEKRKELLRGYYTAITAMDKGIGEIVRRVEQLGIRDETMIIFMSDNGMNLGHHGIWGKGNGTFPQNMYDTSVKVPAIFSHPGHIPAGKVCSELISQYDIFPTLLDYLDIEHDMVGLPGTSFAPLLRGAEQPGRDDVVVFDEYGPVRMIRTREWKYVHRYPYGPHELFDLSNDPDEKQNLIEDAGKETIVTHLRAELQNWFVRYADQAFDGTREPVTGFGQLNWAGPRGRGTQAFEQGRLRVSAPQH